MKNIYFTCGPSQLYPTVTKHLKTALEEEILSLSHRSQKFKDIFKSTQDSLRKLLSIPKSQHIFFMSSSLESMERILENCVEKKSFHLVDGSFSQKWEEEAVAENKRTTKFSSEWGSGLNIDKIKIDKLSEIICVTQNETSTGISLSPKLINRLATKFPDKLIAVDIVSSAPYPKINFKNIDFAFFSVQKGFGLPAGLSVLIVSKRALHKAKILTNKGIVRTAFHSFDSLLAKEKIFQTPETPNVLGIYLLGKVAEDMLKIGINKIRKNTEIKAKLIYDFFDGHSKYNPQVKDLDFRSKTTINIFIGKEKNTIMKRLESKGMIVSSGYGKFKETHIRIANFPAHSLADFNNLIISFDN